MKVVPVFQPNYPVTHQDFFSKAQQKLHYSEKLPLIPVQHQASYSFVIPVVYALTSQMGL